MENPTERNPRPAEFMDKHRHIIDKSAKYLELQRERALERIAKAKRDAALTKLTSNENERAVKYRPLTREQHRLNKGARRASRRAKNATKKMVVQETEDNVKEFLKSIN